MFIMFYMPKDPFHKSFHLINYPEPRVERGSSVTQMEIWFEKVAFIESTQAHKAYGLPSAIRECKMTIGYCHLREEEYFGLQQLLS